ncbi:hypothetical protein Tco_1336840, partial [Tanacetum coccineum]
FSMGRAVWHEPEQFSSELNNISLIEDYLYHKKLYEPLAEAKPTSIKAEDWTLLDRQALGTVMLSLAKNVAYNVVNEKTTYGLFKALSNIRASFRISVQSLEVNMAARDNDDALVCCVKNTVEDHITDSGASFHATYCKEELERLKLRSGKTLKDVRYIPSLKRRLISVGQLDEEGYHVGFGDQQWKVTKGSLVVTRGNKRGSLYMVEVHPEGIGAIIDGIGSVVL